MSGLVHEAQKHEWTEAFAHKASETSEPNPALQPSLHACDHLHLLAQHKTGTRIFKILGFQEREKIRKIYHGKVISISAASLCLGRPQSQVAWERGSVGTRCLL